MKAVRKMQAGGSIPDYRNIKKSTKIRSVKKDYVPTSKDSTAYKKGFEDVVEGKNPLFPSRARMQGKAEARQRGLAKKAQNGDTIPKPKTKAWQHMTAGERGAKKAELVKKGGIELFNKYKDSISKEATGKLQTEFEKGAKSKGMTNEQYSRYLEKQKRKPDQNQGTGGFNEKRYNQLPCSGGSCKKSKNGSKITKAKDGKWMQKAAASIKRRGTEGKCTPITKPGCTGKAKALAKTFKKIAAKRKGK